MKKTLLLLVAALTIATTVSAQYIHYNYYTPWDGNKAYSLNVGTNLDMNDSTFGFSTKHIPLAASFRYDGEKDINESLSWGYQAEVSYLRHGSDYSVRYDIDPTQTVIGSKDNWNLQLDLRLTLGYYFTDNFELAAGVGVYYDLIKGANGEKYRTDNLTGLEVPGSREQIKNIDIFSTDMGASFYLGANYFLNEELFLTLSLRDLIGTDFFELVDGTSSFDNRFIALIGIGYKALR